MCPKTRIDALIFFTFQKSTSIEVLFYKYMFLYIIISFKALWSYKHISVDVVNNILWRYTYKHIPLEILKNCNVRG